MFPFWKWFKYFNLIHKRNYSVWHMLINGKELKCSKKGVVDFEKRRKEYNFDTAWRTDKEKLAKYLTFQCFSQIHLKIWYNILWYLWLLQWQLENNVKKVYLHTLNCFIAKVTVVKNGIFAKNIYILKSVVWGQQPID